MRARWFVLLLLPASASAAPVDTFRDTFQYADTDSGTLDSGHVDSDADSDGVADSDPVADSDLVPTADTDVGAAVDSDTDGGGGDSATDTVVDTDTGLPYPSGGQLAAELANASGCTCDGTDSSAAAGTLVALLGLVGLSRRRAA